MGLQVLQYADIEVAYDTPEQIGRLAGLINHLRDENTVVCGSGDNIGPGVLSLMTRGRQALDFFRAVEADVETFGNHDFDHGVDALLSVVDDAPQTWVCANAFHEGGRFGETVGVAPWTVVETKENVGVIGVAHPETNDINPNAAGVKFTDPIRAVESAIDALAEQAVDHRLVVSHLGDDRTLAESVEVDVILGGHDHTNSVERIDGTLVCRPGGTGRYLLEVSLGGDSPTATHHPVEEGPLDPELTAALRDRIESAGLADTVGVADEPILCDLMATKRAESRIGNLVTDAYRWKSGADVALNTGGGFRRHPPLTGEVTAFDLVKVSPFDSDLLVLDIDGETLLQAFRQLALDDAPDDLPRWHFGHVSGAELVWDDEANELSSAHVDGDPVDPNDEYELATTEFFVGNDGLFPAFGPDDVVERFGPQYEVLVEYVRETGFDLALEGRVRRPALKADDVPERNWPNSP